LRGTSNVQNHVVLLVVRGGWLLEREGHHTKPVARGVVLQCLDGIYSANR
jgi:hypothetical protein